MNPPAKQPHPPRQYKNRILAALSKAEIDRLAPHLLPVKLKVWTQLLDGRADYAYFLEEGLVSIVLTLADGSTIEVGVVGVDDVVGIPILLGADGMPGKTFIQVAGSGFRLNAKRLKNEFERPGQLRRHLQKVRARSSGAERAERRLQPTAHVPQFRKSEQNWLSCLLPVTGCETVAFLFISGYAED